jgi:hypothetical protein
MAGQQVFAAVADQLKEGVIRLGNAIKLAGNYTGDGGFDRRGPETRPCPPELLVALAWQGSQRSGQGSTGCIYRVLSSSHQF